MSCPHTLVYVPPDGQRAVVVKLAGEKCNKLVCAHVDLREQRSWEFVAFAGAGEQLAAANFAADFMYKDREKPLHRQEALYSPLEYDMLYTMRAKDAEELFERTDTGTLVATKYHNGFRDEVEARCLGCVQCLNQMQMFEALNSLRVTNPNGAPLWFE